MSLILMTQKRVFVCARVQSGAEETHVFQNRITFNFVYLKDKQIVIA